MNRREAIEALVAMPAITRIQSATAESDDVIVIECQGPISEDTATRIKAYLLQVWPNRKCVVLGDGLTLKLAKQ